MLEIPFLLSVALLIFTVVLRWSFKNDDHSSSKTPHHVISMASSAEAPPTMADFDVDPFQGQISNFTPVMRENARYECAVCLSLTSTRCSRCKAVRYCSSKCQIIHWRQGHKYECHPQGPSSFERDDSNEDAKTVKQGDTTDTRSAEDLPRKDEKNIMGQLDDDDVLGSPVPRLSSVTTSSLDIETGRSSSGEYETSIMGQREDKKKSMDNNTYVKKLNKEKSRQNDRVKSRPSNSDISQGFRKDNSFDRTPGNIPYSKPNEGLFVNNERQAIKQRKVKSSANKHSGSSLMASNSVSSDLPHSGFTSSFQRAAQHSKPPHQKNPPQNSLLGMSANRNHKTMSQYDAFFKLYSSNEVELKPFGLTNCGNSCYANAVLQCLAYTRPLTIYFLQGLHTRECWKEDWCFLCEFEQLMLKGKQGYTPLSPIRILSNISHLGHGREEDAHEFLRYAVDSMQSVCVELSRVVGPEREGSTLVGMTFGGFLQSKIKCLKCDNRSEKFERMMDLTVEIDGDVRTLEQALRRFTASETLDGNNKYYCSRCKTYKKAKKKLSIFQAPNILTIVLKRFQAGSFTKLKKPVQFPDILNLTPYMSDLNDKYPQYNLYAVVVHLDVSRAEFSGHYVCYVKNYREEWFKIDDSVVISVDLRTVLAEEAYMLLYARDTPRPPVSGRDFDGKTAGVNFEVAPANHTEKYTTSNGRHRSSDVSVDPWVIQHQPSKSGYAKDNSFVEEWVTHSVESIPRVDSSSEVSSLFSNSEEGTCSTPSTKDSASVDDFSDYIFGRGSTGRR